MKSETVKICPKTGMKLYSQCRSKWPLVLLPITGLLALVWFLSRVIPKPSRATYPCQRMAAPLASGFVVWVIGLFTSVTILRRARLLLHQPRYVLAAICAVAAVPIIWSSISASERNPAAAVFSPSEPVNSPMGTAKGNNAGRVV
jgi:hypothetical protein